MVYLGDYVVGEAVHFMWNSADSNGASITRSTDGTVSVYKDNSDTQTTTGVTDTENVDGLTGVHRCVIDTSDAFYATGSDFMVVLSGATIDTRTVNAVLAHFSINNRSGLRPTTAGRTLDVSAGGEAGVDWANVGSPTTALNLSGTNIDVDQIVASVSGAVASVTGAVGSVTGNVGGNVVGSVGSVTGAVGSVTASVAVATNNDKTGYAIGTGGITTVSFAAGALDVAATAVALLAAMADKFLGRNVSGGSDGGRTVSQMTHAIRNKVTRDATGFVTVFGPDDTAVSWTAVAATGNLGPIVSVDPT